MSKFKFTFDGSTLSFPNIDADVAVTVAAAVRAMLTGTQQVNPDPLEDALRPGGTPKSPIHRELEDAVANEVGGELVVTHAAGAQPVLVPKGAEPVGMEPAVENERRIVPRRDEEPEVSDPGQDQVALELEEEVPEPEHPEVDEAEALAAHAQRWNRKKKYGDNFIKEKAVGQDYVVILTLDNGEKVYLDNNDNEIKRSVEKVEDQTQAAIGDFKPGTKNGKLPPPRPEVLKEQEANAEPVDVDLPAGLSKAATLKEAVMSFVDHGVEPLAIIDQVAAVQDDYAVLKGKQNIKDRVIRILNLVGKLSSEQVEAINAR